MGHTQLGVLDREFLDEEFNKLSQSFRIILSSLAKRLEKTTRVASMAVVRRKEKRIPRNLSLTFVSRDELIQACSENISLSGIFIKTSKPFEVGKRFQLNLNLLDQKAAMTIGCEVAWNRHEDEARERYPAGMGVRFIDISEPDRLRLANELRKSQSGSDME